MFTILTPDVPRETVNAVAEWVYREFGSNAGIVWERLGSRSLRSIYKGIRHGEGTEEWRKRYRKRQTGIGMVSLAVDVAERRAQTVDVDFDSADLTFIERVIVGLYKTGYSQASIARILDVTPGTIMYHVTNIRKKIQNLPS